MKIIRNTIKLFILSANVMVGLGFLFCAYSPTISPTSHPVMACAGMCIPIFIILNLCFLVFWCVVELKKAIFPVAFFILGWNPLMSYCPVNLFTPGCDGDKLKVLTYNVMQMQQEEGGKNPIVEYINSSDADIVCLQEFPYKDKKVRRLLQKQYPYMRVCAFNGVNSVACLSKYPVSLIREIKLKSAFNGSALFKVKYKKFEIPVIVNHLESNKLNDHDKKVYKELLKSPDEKHVKTDGKYLLEKLADAMSIRAVQADVVAGNIEKEYSPYMVVCGDFNDTPISYTHNKIGERLTDAFVEAGNGTGITYNRNFLFFRIDHIMVGDYYKVIDCKVDNSIDASDHYPIYTELCVRKP